MAIIYWYHRATARVMLDHNLNTLLKNHPRLLSLAPTSLLLLSQMGNVFVSGGGTIG